MSVNEMNATLHSGCGHPGEARALGGRGREPNTLPSQRHVTAPPTRTCTNHALDCTFPIRMGLRFTAARSEPQARAQREQRESHREMPVCKV